MALRGMRAPSRERSLNWLGTPTPCTYIERSRGGGGGEGGETASQLSHT